ncbi:MAG TPA: hypothetical protein PK867_04525 [Pirellulales bacterium]|nr:hypothetical protein [Pirellulales bacterium]
MSGPFDPDGKRPGIPAQEPKDSAPQRRRWQFTLRRLAVAVALISGLLALWVKFGEPYRKERQVIAQLESSGLSVRTESYGPVSLQRLLGARAPTHITAIVGSMSDDDLKQLRLLPKLYELRLHGGKSSITDAGLKEIGTLTTLDHLAIESAKITDRGVSHLAALKDLRSLELPHQISDAAMAHLRSLKALQRLICAEQSPAQQRIVAALEEQTELDFSEQPLIGVVDYVQQRHDIAIDCRELLRSKGPIDAPITCQLKGLTLATAMRQILDPLGLDHKLSANRLALTTREALEAARPQLTSLRRELPALTTAIVDWEVPPLESPDGRPPSEEDQALESLGQLSSPRSLTFEVDRGRSVSGISLANTRADDESLKNVAKLTKLRQLDLSGTGISSSGLSSLAGLDRLVVLGLNRTGVDDQGMRTVARWRELRELLLDGTAVSDRGIAMIAGLRKLARLSICRTAVTGKGLAELKRLPALDWLRLEGVGDDALANLEGCARLRSLLLAGPQLGDPAMEAVARLTTLENLDLDHTSVTLAGLRELSALPKLVGLSVRGADFNRGSLAPLAELTQLTNLVVTGAAISDESLGTLAGSKKLEFLSVDFAPITDAGLERFPPLAALRSLNLFRTKVAPGGVAKLRRRLPKLRVCDKQGNWHAALEE